ncbi:MAG: PepSY domain-containing protein [Niabella sp.]
MLKHIYKWHRKLSLIIAIPVLLWALSGILHPLMTTIRPALTTQQYRAPAIDTAQIKISLQQCLLQNDIDSFVNVHIVHIAGQQYYQVAVNRDKELKYFSTLNGMQLNNGNQLYARYLAKIFLEGEEQTHYALPATDESFDCCANTTMRVLTEKGARVTSVKIINDFSGEYKEINRLLPVYKVLFARKDGIRVYVKTEGSRFAYAVDNKRAFFDKVFGWLHTWSWMDGLGRFKYLVMVIITLLAFVTSGMGVYIFFKTKAKKSDKRIVKARRNHRYTALIASLFSLMFTFSGGYHALSDLLQEKEKDTPPVAVLPARAIAPDFNKLSKLAGAPIQQLSVCRIGHKNYWQLLLDTPSATGPADLMKARQVAPPELIYVDASDYTVLSNGENRYAKYLAAWYSKKDTAGVRDIKLVTQFNAEYGFINKRLPVWRVTYGGGNEKYFVETTSGSLALHLTNGKKAEGYSFAFLHKHYFMDWAGKTVKDGSTILAAGLQVLMIVFGCILYIISGKRKRNHSKANV